MSKILAVAWREFRHTALTKAFIIGGLVFPLIIWALFPIIALFTQETIPPLSGTLAVIDTTGEVDAALRVEFDPERLAREEAERNEGAAEIASSVMADPAKAAEIVQENPELAAGLADETPAIAIEIESVTDERELDALKKRVRDGDLVAVARVVPTALMVRGPDEKGPREPVVSLYLPSDIKSKHTDILEREISQAVRRARAARSGQDVEALQRLLERPRIDSVALGEDGGESEDQSDLKKILPFAFMILLWMTSFTGGNYLLTTTIEEKSNKLMEVLLSAVSPLQLMTGKIIGQGFVALVMLIMYGGLGMAALIAFASTDLITYTQLGLMIVYFVMAYFYIATLMAAIGSAVNDIHEAQTLMTPAMLLLMLPLLLMIPVVESPNGPLALVASFIPPLTPFVMVCRIAADEVPVWQIALSLGVGFTAVFAALWGCARIFRVGVLMQGKPPTPLELVKWLRYS